MGLGSRDCIFTESVVVTNCAKAMNVQMLFRASRGFALCDAALIERKIAPMKLRK